MSEKLEHVQRLFFKAGNDLRSAADLIRSQTPATDVICFHCQQAVEKAIKALLVLHQIDFRKLHDIGQLLELLRCSPTPPSDVQTHGLDSLTRFAVETRYPPGEASPDEASRALELAKEFLEWVKGALDRRI